MPHAQSNIRVSPDLKLREILLHRLEARDLDLPILPQAATAVLEACRDEETGPRQVAETLQRDPALAGHVLRVANSAAYAAADPIVSLSQAVSRLGLATVAEMTMAVVLKACVFRPGRHAALVHPVWAHSAAAGGWAREIARLRRRNVESAFLCGLLHDVGRPVIVQAAIEIERSSQIYFDDAEVCETLDELHETVGAELARRWGLPEWMESAILWHHAPEVATMHHEAVKTTALADRLANWLLEEKVDDDEDLHRLTLVADLDIYPEEFKELLGKREQILHLAEALA